MTACEQCGQELTRPTQSRFCSRACAHAFQHPPVYVTCVYCGSQRRLVPHEVSKHTTCGSQECKRRMYAERQAGRWKRGIYSPETIGRMVESMHSFRPPDLVARIVETQRRNGTLGNKHIPDNSARLSRGHTLMSPERRRQWIEHITSTARGRFASYPPEQQEAIRQACRVGTLAQHPRVVNTSIERLLHEELQRRGVPFVTHHLIAKVCRPDICLVEYPVVIEADGDYWHRRPGMQERDLAKTVALQAAGYTVFRFWEHDIRADPAACIDSVLTHRPTP